MELPLNKIAALVPSICESGHERLAPDRNTKGEAPRHLPQPVITMIRLNNIDSHGGVPQTGGAKISHVPVAPSRKRPAPTRASPKKTVSTTRKPMPTPNPTPSNRPPIPAKPSVPTQKLTPSKRAIPQHVIDCKRELPSMRSLSSLSSCITEAPNRHPTAPVTPPNSPCEEPPLVRRGSMSEQAAETDRILEWAKEIVIAAEKRAREHERAANEKREFVLRLRTWEAEMKLRRLEEHDNVGEEDMSRGEESSERVQRISWMEMRSEMGRYRSFVWERRKRCCRGIASVLDRDEQGQ